MTKTQPFGIFFELNVKFMIFKI